MQLRFILNSTLTILCTLYIGESGLVYKGYIDTALGSELVAVKTGKGIKIRAQIDFHHKT